MDLVWAAGPVGGGAPSDDADYATVAGQASDLTEHNIHDVA